MRPGLRHTHCTLIAGLLGTIGSIPEVLAQSSNGTTSAWTGDWTHWPLVDLLLRCLLLSGLALVLAAGWSRFIRASWRSGYDRPRHLAFTIAPVRAALGLFVVFGVLAPLSVAQHDQTVTLAVILLATSAIGSFSQLRDAIAGLHLCMTRPFRIGDPIAHQGNRGRVRWLGLTRVHLQSDDGSILRIPCYELSRGPLVTRAQRSRALPITITVEIAESTSDARVLDALRDEVLLSPYVDVQAPLSITRTCPKQWLIRVIPCAPEDAPELTHDILSRTHNRFRVKSEMR